LELDERKSEIRRRDACKDQQLRKRLAGSPKELCESPGSDCTSNPDGSYDIKFVTYFAAQDTFKAARLLTVGTIGFVVLSAVVRCLYTYALAKRRLNVKV
jgi:hypothetical protein